MIYDPNTNTAIADSVQIAQYLDRTYPATPAVFPAGTAAFEAALVDIMAKEVVMSLIMTVSMERIGSILSARSFAHFEAGVRPLIAMFEATPEEARWKAAEDALGKVQGWLSTNGPGKDMHFMGDTFCFVDFQLASILLSLKIIYGERSGEWERLCGWHKGKWKAFLQRFEPYMSVEDN